MIVLTQHEKDLLHSKNGLREIKFQYDLLDMDDNYKKTLKNVISCSIDYKSLAEIKRTATIQLQEDSDIDYLNDKIQPFMMIKNGEKWLKWSLGIFMLNSPTRNDSKGVVIRDIKAYDMSQILVQDKVTNRYPIKKNTNYITAISDVLLSAGVTKVKLTNTSKTLQTDREFPIGTTKLSIINSLLEEINYTSVTVDEVGYFVSNPYISPSDRLVDYEYKTDATSIIFNGLTETLDLFNVPNQFVAVLSNPEQEVLKSIYINDNPKSVTSIASRERVITDYRKVNNIADQQELDTYIKMIAENASNVYGYAEFETAIMPHHGCLNCIQLDYTSMDIKDKYIETNWSMQLKEGARMKHKVRRVVYI